MGMLLCGLYAMSPTIAKEQRETMNIDRIFVGDFFMFYDIDMQVKLHHRQHMCINKRPILISIGKLFNVNDLNQNVVVVVLQQ